MNGEGDEAYANRDRAMRDVLQKQKDAVGTEYAVLKPMLIQEDESCESKQVGQLKEGEIVIVEEEKFSEINAYNVFDKPITRVRIDRGWISKSAHSGAVLLAPPDSQHALNLKPPEMDVYDKQLQTITDKTNNLPVAPRRKKKQSMSQLGRGDSWDGDNVQPGTVKVVQSDVGAVKLRKIADDVADLSEDSQFNLMFVVSITCVLSLVFFLIVAHTAGWTCDDHNECA